VSEGVPFELGRLKRRYFAIIDFYSVNTVADKYRLAAYHNKQIVMGFLNLSTSMTLNDLEPFSSPKGGFSEFFAIFGCSAHFNNELRRNSWK